MTIDNLKVYEYYITVKYNNLVIDTNQYYKAAFSIIVKQNPTDAQDMIINKTIHLTLLMILKVKNSYLSDDGKIYVLADNPTSKNNMRKLISNGEYKCFRQKESDGYYRGIDYLLLICNYYSDQFFTARVKRLEADDLVPEILKSCFGKTLLCSSDLDWARCMSSNVDWYNHTALYTQESFKKKFKYIPNEKTVTLMKVLMGDNSDNIPSVKEITEQIALNLIYNFDDIFEILDCIKKNTEKAKLMSEYTKKVLLKNEKRLLTNQNLVYFCEVSNTEIEQAVMKGNFDSKNLSILYKALNFPENFDSRIEDIKISFGDIFKFDEVQRK